MAAYNGSLVPSVAADMPPSRCWTNERQQNKNVISDAEAHGGTFSLRLIGGGYYDIFYGCDAGSATITVWVLAPAIGKCGIQIFDGVELMGEDFNSGSLGAWEQLSVTFTAEKKVYTVRLINATLQDGDTRAYFDDLV